MEEEFDESIQPEDFGLIKIPIPVPPMLETALGYPGDKRYAAFHECHVSVPGFVVEDIDHRWPGIAAGWLLFCKHPIVAKVLDAARLDLMRQVPIIPWKEWIAMAPSQHDDYWRKTRCLVLDREARSLYIGVYPSVILFLPFERASREPKGDGNDEIPDEEVATNVDALLREHPEVFDSEPEMDAQAPVEITRDVLRGLRDWLDEERLKDDYTPRPAESCGFQRTSIAVEPGQIEGAFNYGDGKRFISLHWSPKHDKVFVCDGIHSRRLSDSADVWRKFIEHPLVSPHLQRSNEGGGRSEAIDFSAHIVKLPESPVFSSEESARTMEADVETSCLLYDRAGNDVYVGSWGSAILFHSLVEDVLEEDLLPGPGPEAEPLLTWLDEHMQDPEHVYSVAVAYHWHRQEEDALAMFSRCVELEPHSHLYWFRFSQTLGWVFKWDGALEACEKALGLHATAPRQFVTARQMLNWKGECLFMLQRYTEAADIYRFVIQIDDFVQRADSYSQLARCCERIGAYREAVDAREREVRERADSFSEALKAGEFDNIDEAIVEIERSFLGEAWLGLGRCYALAGNIEAAEWAFRRVVEMDAESTRARTELAALLRHVGRVEDAEKQFRDALTLATRKVGQTPELGSAHSDLAFVYRAMGNYSEADRAAERAADLGWRSSDEQRPVFRLDAAVADSSR